MHQHVVQRACAYIALLASVLVSCSPSISNKIGEPASDIANLVSVSGELRILQGSPMRLLRYGGTNWTFELISVDSDVDLGASPKYLADPNAEFIVGHAAGRDGANFVLCRTDGSSAWRRLDFGRQLVAPRVYRGVLWAQVLNHGSASSRCAVLAIGPSGKVVASYDAYRSDSSFSNGRPFFVDMKQRLVVAGDGGQVEIVAIWSDVLKSVGATTETMPNRIVGSNESFTLCQIGDRWLRVSHDGTVEKLTIAGTLRPHPVVRDDLISMVVTSSGETRLFVVGNASVQEAELVVPPRKGVFLVGYQDGPLYITTQVAPPSPVVIVTTSADGTLHTDENTISSYIARDRAALIGSLMFVADIPGKPGEVLIYEAGTMRLLEALQLPAIGD